VRKAARGIPYHRLVVPFAGIAYLIAGSIFALSYPGFWAYWPAGYLWWAIVLLPITVVLALSRENFAKIVAIEIASYAITILTLLAFSHAWKDMLAPGFLEERLFIELIVFVQGMALQLAAFGLIRFVTRILPLAR
jgi:hypothetical protein